MNPLAPILGQGAPIAPGTRRGGNGSVNAWPRVQQALRAAGRPLSCAELRTATGLDQNNLSVALATHKEQLVRDGDRKPFRYSLRGAA